MATSRSKGKSAELRWRDKLNKILPEYAPWIRNPVDQARGDLVPEDPARRDLFHVECKYRDKQPVTVATIHEWWEAMNSLVRLRGARTKVVTGSVMWIEPLLCVKARGFPWFIISHRELDQIRVRCRENNILWCGW